MAEPQKVSVKITENTLIPVSLVCMLLSGSWAASKLDSRVEVLEKNQHTIERIEKRLYKIEIKTGVDKPGPLIEGD